MAESNKGAGVFFYSEIDNKEDMGSASLQKFNSISTKNNNNNNKNSTKSKKKLNVSGDSRDINFRVDRMTAVGSFITSPSSSSPAAIARGETQQNNNSDNNNNDNNNNEINKSNNKDNNSAVISSSPLSRSRSISTPPSPSLSLNNNNNNNNNNTLKTRLPSHKSMSLLPIPEPSAPPADEKERERGREGNVNPPSYSEAITPDGEDQSAPRQTTSKPAKVFKRNPSFWDASKRSRNQLTLRRYQDVGVVTVTLNVSGTIFATSTNTLLREPDTLFATILEREESSIRSGKHIFLDRNPKYFGPILDYMRTGNFDRDAHIKIAKSIMIEAEFFKIGGMIKILHDVPEFTRKDILKILNGTERPKLRGLWLPTINLAGMDMTRANLDFSQLGKSNLRNVLLGGASICNATLVEVNLRNAVLNNAVIAHSEFVRANMSNATMKFVKMLNCDFTGADLSYCIFEGADVQQCDFTGANLTGVDFTSADLSRSIFRDAIFSEETVFENTITKTADFEGSNIEVTKKKRSVLSMLGKKK